MSFCCGLPFDRTSAAPVPCQAAFGWPGRAPHAPGAPGAPGFPRQLRPELAHWQRALKDQSGREVSLQGHGDSGEVVKGGAGDVEQDSFDERLPILTPDAVGRAGHAPTDEERGREYAVVGSARMVGGPDWTPSDEGARMAGVR